MRTATLCWFVFAAFSLSARADLTIVQRIEGAGPATEMTIKIKGDKARVDVTPQLATIVDSKTGEMINLMKDQKAVVRVSAAKMKAAAEMVSKYNGGTKDTAAAGKPKLVATGKKEKVNEYDTEEYACETPAYKAAYWVATRYPNAPAILQQLQSLNPQLWSPDNIGVPDYRDFPGVPIRTVISMNGNQISTTLVSIKQDPIAEAEFAIPADYQEMKTPDLSNLLRGEENKSSPNPSP